MDISKDIIQAKTAALTAENSFFETTTLCIDGSDYRGFKHAPSTIIEIINNARNHQQTEFLIAGEQRLSFGEFFELVDCFAASLQSTHQVRKGDRVAIAMRNNIEWMVAFCAAALVGAIVVPINSWGKKEELSYAIGDCGASLLVCDQARYQLIADQRNALAVTVVLVADSSPEPAVVSLFNEEVQAGAKLDFAAPDSLPEDPSLILYTSGSTGFPKGVLHCNRAIGQQAMNMMFSAMLTAEFEGGMREYRGGADREAMILTTPLFHGLGLMGGLIMPLIAATKIVLMKKWDAAEALRIIQAEKITSFSTVPAILQELLRHPNFDSTDTSTLIRISASGAATPVGLPELINSKVPNPSRSAGFGMTETIGPCSLASGALYDIKPDSAGIPLPITEIRLVDTSGNVCKQGESGEIEIRSVCCMTGYWEKPDANAAVFQPGGWMKTGDIGALDDDGYLFITGRIKELVIRGGENIFPGEIEQAAYEIAGVSEVVVFGIPDQAMGEELVMVLYAGQSASVDEPAVRQFLEQRLSGFKVPKTIKVEKEHLPRNASEKLNKIEVKKRFLELETAAPV